MESGKWKVSYIRDGLIDEFHEGFVSFGADDFEQPYYLRSCAKPLQATLLADYDVDLTPEELAVVCGSHAGEDCHVDIIKKLLEKFGLDESFLKCGVHAPLSHSKQNKMLLTNEKPRAEHNNCSGKHTGFLILCKKNGWDLLNYDRPEHPLQQEIKRKINSMCEVDREYPVTTDGCGVPILSMPLKNMVKGFLKLLDYPQIINAIKENPYIYGGENRTDTEIIQKTDNLIAKVGAGGLCVVLNYSEQKAFAVKINDCSYDARRIAVFEIINSLGWGKIDYDNTIRTIGGKVVGKIQTTLN